MVVVKIGNLFDSSAQTLVNTVNCVGVMGKGVALEFKQRFPEMHEDYVARCKAGRVKLGQPYLYRSLVLPWILNFPTKDHWRSVSRLKDIEEGLGYLLAHYKEWGITSIAIPPLGCGQGQLEWRIVGPTLFGYLKRLGISVELYAPFGTPHDELKPTFLDQAVEATAAYAPVRVGAAWVALVEILSKIQEEPHHWPVGRTTFQKIAYFATQSGLPTGLRYQRGSYGPYSPELKKRIMALVNNGLVREERLSQMFAVRVGHTFDDARRAYGGEIANWQTAIDKVSDLFMRMRTHQAEIAATVHFATSELKEQSTDLPSESDVLRQVMEWKQRRRPPLDEKAVALSIRALNILSWLGARVSDDLPVSENEFLPV
jgi:O-acetyl-ADP-ribose deacetylase (regulator of RNase III)